LTTLDLQDIDRRKDKLLQELVDIPQKKFHQILPLYIVFPRTKHIEKDLKDQDACIFEYDNTFKFEGQSQIEILRHPTFQRHHIKAYSKEVLNLLFPLERNLISDIPNPNDFDNIVIQYYKIPILIGKNKQPTKEGYSIFIEITSLRQGFSNVMDEEIRKIKLEELRKLTETSNTHWTLKSLGAAVGLGAVTVTVATIVTTFVIMKTK